MLMLFLMPLESDSVDCSQLCVPFFSSIKQLHCDEYRDSEGESKDFHLLAVMGAEEELE